jgi:hypothetical protein
VVSTSLTGSGTNGAKKHASSSLWRRPATLHEQLCLSTLSRRRLAGSAFSVLSLFTMAARRIRNDGRTMVNSSGIGTAFGIASGRPPAFRLSVDETFESFRFSFGVSYAMFCSGFACGAHQPQVRIRIIKCTESSTRTAPSFAEMFNAPKLTGCSADIIGAVVICVDLLPCSAKPQWVHMDATLSGLCRCAVTLHDMWVSDDPDDPAEL